MNHHLGRFAAAVVTTAAALASIAVPAASADVPSFDRCPRSVPGLLGCVVVQSTDGSIAANNHRLPLTGANIKVEGGLDGDFGFVPPATGSALTAKPVDVPGGLFGRNLPYNLNKVKATVEQVGAVNYDYFSYRLTVNVRIHFTNALLGPNCAIGSATSPLTLAFTPDTTSPPAPNTPISGDYGAFTSPPGTWFAITDMIQVDNAFAVPAATGCGVVAQAAVTKAINDNLGLPSAAGHYNDVTLKLNQYVTGA